MCSAQDLLILESSLMLHVLMLMPLRINQRNEWERGKEVDEEGGSDHRRRPWQCGSENISEEIRNSQTYPITPWCGWMDPNEKQDSTVSGTGSTHAVHAPPRWHIELKRYQSVGWWGLTKVAVLALEGRSRIWNGLEIISLSAAHYVSQTLDAAICTITYLGEKWKKIREISGEFIWW